MKALAILLVALTACGGPTKRTVKGGRTATEKREKIKPAAMRDFEAGMRALRLGGPDANDTARGRLRSAVKADSSLWEAWYNLGVIAWREGEDDEAIDDFSKALAQNRDHTPTLMARAEAYRRAAKKKEARADYEAALKAMEEDDPNRRDVAARLASLLRDAGEYEDAVEVLRETVRVSGTNARIYTELGQIYIAQKRLELAQLMLAKALELDAKDPSVYNALALLAQRQGKAQEAFERYDQAVSLDAKYIDARFNKATVLLDAGDYARAKAELAVIVDNKSDDYAAWVSLGVAQRGLGAFPEARKAFDRVVKEAPKRSAPRADAMWNLVILKNDFTNDTAGAKVDLERYLQEAPTTHSKRQEAQTLCQQLKCH